ncbi:transposase [Kitasatospora sp. NPDC052896]|uniref:transposase n=1 Tax=Kitasatospora sp. NPDC052896 TaxID=3364061 RepID=UPI0037C65F8D
MSTHQGEGPSFKAVADDLNVNHETLRAWVREAEGAGTPGGGSQAESAEAELARLRAENARLLKHGNCRS